MIKPAVSDEFVVCVLRRQRTVANAVKALMTLAETSTTSTNRRRGTQAATDGGARASRGGSPGRRATDPDFPGLQSECLILEPTLAVILLTAEEIWSASKHAAGPDLFESSAEFAARDALITAIRSAMVQAPGRSEAATSAAETYFLTVREREVLEQMIAGETSKEIARILQISPRTVQVHRSRVLSKLSARNATEAVRIALAAGENAQHVRLPTG